AAMRTWRDTSPYRWVGYYLPAPCYTGTSWVGTRERLASIGWGMVPLFVGEQDWSVIRPDDAAVAEQGARCTSRNLTAAQGAADAAVADSILDAEGFPPGTPVFLDVERMERVTRAMEEYVHAWFTEMLERGRYTPSFYAHERNVTPLFERARAAFETAGRSDQPFLWVARAGDMTVTSRPSDSGILSAAIWQRRFGVDETLGGLTVRSDANVARRARHHAGSVSQKLLPMSIVKRVFLSRPAANPPARTPKGVGQIAPTSTPLCQALSFSRSSNALPTAPERMRSRTAPSRKMR